MGDVVSAWVGTCEGVPDRVWIWVLVPLWVPMLLGLRVAEAVATWDGVGLRVGGGVALHEGVQGCVRVGLQVMAVVGVLERVTGPVAVEVWLLVSGCVGLRVPVQLALRLWLAVSTRRLWVWFHSE